MAGTLRCGPETWLGVRSLRVPRLHAGFGPLMRLRISPVGWERDHTVQGALERGRCRLEVHDWAPTDRLTEAPVFLWGREPLEQDVGRGVFGSWHVPAWHGAATLDGLPVIRPRQRLRFIRWSWAYRGYLRKNSHRNLV